VTYDPLPYTRVALSQIRRLTTPLVDYEVLVYDNGSTDGTVQFLEREGVVLFRGEGNSMRHGRALDFLVERASMDVVCTLCSDAFPVSRGWLTPALYVDGRTVLAGIDRGWGRMLDSYVCPSYLFGWREWMAAHSFAARWPEADTGEQMAYECLVEGKEMRTWDHRMVDFGEGFSPKPCDYNGWVWHTFWGTRRKVVAGLAGTEFELSYHERAAQVVKERYGLEVGDG